MKSYKSFTLILCMSFFLSLTACSSKNTSQISTGDASFDKKDLVVDDTTVALNKNAIVGLWTQGDNLYFFAPDGQFISFTNIDIAGGSWALNNEQLTLALYDKVLNPMTEEILTGVIKDDSQMLLVGEGNHKSVWTKSEEKVSAIPVEFYIRERIMLPPVIMLETKLNQNNKSRFVSRSIYKTAGANRIPMNVYYLADRVDANKAFELDAIVFFENSYLFVTEKTAIVSTKQKSSLEIMLVQPSADRIAKLMAENEESIATLANTYWKLIKLEGKTPKIENTEVHMILRHGEGLMGEGNGNDGCNNYFLSWERPAGNSKNAIKFSLGGSTMMMCTEEIMSQGVQYLQNLDKINKYTIQGNNLLLQENNKTRLVFEAVAL